MKRILSWIIMIPFALVVIVFSAVNRELVTLDLWPLPHEITVPVFTLVLAVFIFGFLWGAVAAWSSAAGNRRRARNAQWRAEAAERELRSLNNKLQERERELESARDIPGDSDKKLPAPASGA
ncbi:LapA family protein [Thalassospiraceae bacterium LMO-JJ14]|nr:LapA family protein [Thalassospiraceae bacterium LMO-JJ14]